MDHQALRGFLDKTLLVAEFGQLPAERVAKPRLLVDAELVQVLEPKGFAADFIERGAQFLDRTCRPAASARRQRRIILRKRLRQADCKLVHLLAGNGTEDTHWR